MAELTLAEVEENLSNAVYQASHWFERAEAAGLVRGNGHHMQQELARKAVEMLREHSYPSAHSQLSVKRWWMSWTVGADDYRPITFPPNSAILGWWCTGHASVNSVLVGLVEAASAEEARAAVLKDWPDKDLQWRFQEEKSSDFVASGSSLVFNPLLSDRFPLADWMRKRMFPQHAKGGGIE